jgi:hypothetical protein
VARFRLTDATLPPPESPSMMQNVGQYGRTERNRLGWALRSAVCHG